MDTQSSWDGLIAPNQANVASATCQIPGVTQSQASICQGWSLPAAGGAGGGWGSPRLVDHTDNFKATTL